jgi:hypothetical protein
MRFRPYRGSWDTVDEYYFHLATRNGLLPWSYERSSGLRPAADVSP